MDDQLVLIPIEVLDSHAAALHQAQSGPV